MMQHGNETSPFNATETTIFFLKKTHRIAQHPVQLVIPADVAHCACERSRSRSWGKETTSRASWSSQNPFRYEILKETFVLMDVWRAERRCHGHGVRCQLW